MLILVTVGGCMGHLDGLVLDVFGARLRQVSMALSLGIR